MTPKERAGKAASAMWASDSASQWMGMTLDHVDEGRASLGLTVKAHHCNGHGNCHGGVIFALADSAFAFACNSRNQATVGQHANISYIAPVRLDDHLTAVAAEVSVSGRNGIYDVRVTNKNNDVVAEMRGMSRAVKGQLFTE